MNLEELVMDSNDDLKTDLLDSHANEPDFER